MAGAGGCGTTHGCRRSRHDPCIGEGTFGRLSDCGSGLFVVVIGHDAEQIGLAHSGSLFKAVLGYEDASTVAYGLGDANDQPIGGASAK